MVNLVEKLALVGKKEPVTADFNVESEKSISSVSPFKLIPTPPAKLVSSLISIVSTVMTWFEPTVIYPPDPVRVTSPVFVPVAAWSGWPFINMWPNDPVDSAITKPNDPVEVNDPDTFPFEVILLNWTLFVVPNDCISPLPSKKAVLVEKLALGAVNEPLMSVAIWAEPLITLSPLYEPLMVDLKVESEKSTANVLSEVKSPPPVNPVPAVRFRDCNVSILDSSVVNLVDILELGAMKEPLISLDNCADALIILFSNSTSAVVTLVEKELLSAVILVENEPLSVTKFVIRVASEDETFTIFVLLIPPILTFPNEPVEVDEPVTLPVTCMFDDVNCVMFALSTEPIWVKWTLEADRLVKFSPSTTELTVANGRACLWLPLANSPMFPWNAVVDTSSGSDV